VFLQAVPIIARIINSHWFIGTSHEARLIFASISFIASYVVVAMAISNRLRLPQLPLAVIACILN
jgi:hypothetical protein